jgi:hypothetical protein
VLKTDAGDLKFDARGHMQVRLMNDLKDYARFLKTDAGGLQNDAGGLKIDA